MQPCTMLGAQDTPVLLHDSWVAQQAPSTMLLELADKQTMHMSTASVSSLRLPAAWPAIAMHAPRRSGCQGLAVQLAAAYSLALGGCRRQASQPPNLTASAPLLSWCRRVAGAQAARQEQSPRRPCRPETFCGLPCRGAGRGQGHARLSGRCSVLQSSPCLL